MADYTIALSVNIKTGNKVRNIVSNRLYRFNNKLTWKRFSMKSYIQRNWHWIKWTMWPILSLTKLPTDTVLVTKCFNQKSDYEEPIQVLQEFDPQLEFCTFTVHRDPKYEDVDNNIHPPPSLKSTFEVLMTRQNPCNKVPVKFSEESPRYTGEFFLLRFRNEIV